MCDRKARKNVILKYRLREELIRLLYEINCYDKERGRRDIWEFI